MPHPVRVSALHGLAVFGAVFVLAACSATTLRSSGAADAEESEVAPPALGASGEGSAASGTSGDGAAEGTEGGEASGGEASGGEASGGEASKSRTHCPLDTTDGSKAAETAGVAGMPRDVNVMQKIVHAHRGCIRRCYETVQKQIPGLKGDMTMTLMITPKGKVKEVSLNKDRSDLFAPPLVECAIDVLKKLEFPAHEKGLESKLNYPFNFQP